MGRVQWLKNENDNQFKNSYFQIKRENNILWQKKRKYYDQLLMEFEDDYRPQIMPNIKKVTEEYSKMQKLIKNASS